MVAGRLRYGLVVLLLIITWQPVVSQGHIYSEISVNKNSVYVGEPVEVSVSVFTSTWFTKGVNPGNVKVNGAFTVYFRGVSKTIQKKSKTYAGVEMIFNVFPYSNEDIVFPSLEIKVETPDVGGYKGIGRTIKTEPKTITVKSIPAGYDNSKWLVSSGVDVKDVWIGDRNRVKIGDVLERTITITAAGTVSGLMPPVVFDSIQGISNYPAGSSAENIRSKTAISAKRTDGVKYLFEKEGTVTIPAIEITWWNSGRRRLYKRTLKEVTLNVQPNPDLGMLESIRDSLSVISSVETDSTDENNGLLLGLTKKQIFYLLSVILLLFVMFRRIVRWIKLLKRNLQKKRERYRQSERYFFNQFRVAVRKKLSAGVVSSLYLWIDHLNLEEPTLNCLEKEIEDAEFTKETRKVTGIKGDKITLNIKVWTKARENYLKKKSGEKQKVSSEWINP